MKVMPSDHPQGLYSWPSFSVFCSQTHTAPLESPSPGWACEEGPMGLQHWTWAPTGLGFISALSTGAEHRLAFFLQQVGEARGSHRTGIRTPVSTHQSWSTALLRPLLQERETELGRVTQPVTTIHFSCSVVSDSLRPHGLQHARPPCPSLTPELAQTHVH